MGAATETVEPYVQYVYQLLEHIKVGRLRVPHFQRPLVWTWAQKRELLRSVRDGIPMGSIMLWDTMQAIPSLDRLHGHPIPESPGGKSRYVLDGLQRLLTLFSALYVPGGLLRDETEDGAESEQVLFDLTSRDFVRSEDVEDDQAYLPMSSILNSVELLKNQRAWKKGSEAWVERSDELARAFREYKVPVIPIEGNDIGLATRTFKLLNSQGTPMDETDMIHALAWSGGFSLRERMAELIEEKLSPIGWGSLGADTIIRVAKLELDLGIYDSSSEESVARGLRSEPAILDRAVNSVVQLAEFLRETCMIGGPALVPYDLQIVFLAHVVGKRTKIGRRVRTGLRDWFFLTTHAELFAGLSGFRVAQTLNELKLVSRDGKVRWSGPRDPQLRPLSSKRFDFKSARSKGLALMLARRQREWLGVDWTDELAVLGRSAVNAIAPRSEGAFASSPGNRFLCRPDQVRELRAEIEAGTLSVEQMEAHLLTKSAVRHAVAGEWERFVAARMRVIAREERRFFDELLQELTDDD